MSSHAESLVNQLRHETSPYLLQHQDNPVHWHSWSEETLALAKAHQKPILLSVGYAACHWCHVMAHESFENEDIAQVMNALFINVKVDREERPDLDLIYQSALALMGEQGGWPLTMFLTPDGEPFWGGTYFPSTPRYGRPGFTQVLQHISSTYNSAPGRVRQNVESLREALTQLSKPEAGESLDAEEIDLISLGITRHFDTTFGGLAGAPKFPHFPTLLRLWGSHKRTANPILMSTVTTTLDAMCEGGIYDHLGGGLSRYSTDEEWLAPHFEKMLYDNAAFIECLTQIWTETGNPLYEQRAAETVAWLLREMVVGDAHGEGGFAGTLDADSEGEEGRFYVWSEPEIDSHLAEMDPEIINGFKTVYDVTSGGNWEGNTILNRRRMRGPYSAEREADFGKIRALLLCARASRPRPTLDDKVLADWNGMMIAALSRAARTFDRPDWLDAALQAHAFVIKSLERDGRFLHSWCRGEARHPGTLDDHAQMALASIALFEATGKRVFLERAIDAAEIIEANFADTAGGGYYLSAADTLDVITRPKTASDNATPSGNAVTAEILARLFHLTGNDTYRRRADTLFKTFSGDIAKSPIALVSLINAKDLLDHAQVIVLTGPEGDHELTQMTNIAWKSAIPNRIIHPLLASDSLPENHLAAGALLTFKQATAVICHGQTCSLPVHSGDELRAIVEQ
ncbi:MAG: thioredoxin domain-containing protein [Rhodospirillaceae bacterium]|nr:thioredoxin domain-containing protein [Rhodospirillaceae bacterium]